MKGAPECAGTAGEPPFSVEGMVLCVSWSLVVNDLDSVRELPGEIYDKVAEDNPAYRGDLEIALSAAKRAGLVSATLAGGRTPSPYVGGPDVVVISVHGFDREGVGKAVPRHDHIEEVLTMLGYPEVPDGVQDA